MKISIIIPVYNEQGSINLLVGSLLDVARRNKDIQLEIIFIDNNRKDIM